MKLPYQELYYIWDFSFTFVFVVFFTFLTPYVLHLFQQCMPSNKHISIKDAILIKRRPLTVYKTGVQVYSMDSRSATGKL